MNNFVKNIFGSPATRVTNSHGEKLILCNGCHTERTVLAAAGSIKIKDDFEGWSQWGENGRTD